MENMGAGEILINSIDREGTMQGYDIDLIKKVAESVSIPVIVCGGAGKIEDFEEAVKKRGCFCCRSWKSLCFLWSNRAILINFPTQARIKNCFILSIFTRDNKSNDR